MKPLAAEPRAVIELAQEVGMRAVPRGDPDNWADVHRLAEGGAGAFSPLEGPPPAEELGPGGPAAVYLREISRTPLLTADEEIQLARELEAGSAAAETLAGDVSDPEEQTRLKSAVRTGQAARRRLIESNLRLVVAVARKYMGRGVPFLDLVQEGNIGLQRGVDKYDWRKGFRFSTYAYWWIRQAISRAVADQGRTIRLPVHVFEQLSKVYNASQDLESELGRVPNPEEIAARLGVSVESVRDALRASRLPISLDAPLGEDETGTVGEVVADVTSPSPAEVAEERVMADRMEQLLHDVLTAREAAVITLRFGLRDRQERTLAEVGEELGISRERVRQVEAEALRKLRRQAPLLRQLRPHSG
jgi:RNA polymerase primary sigma factor